MKITDEILSNAFKNELDRIKHEERCKESIDRSNGCINIIKNISQEIDNFDNDIIDKFLEFTQLYNDIVDCSLSMNIDKAFEKLSSLHDFLIQEIKKLELKLPSQAFEIYRIKIFLEDHFYE